MRNSFKRLRKDGKYLDLILKINQELSIKVHKIMMMEYSGFIKMLLERNDQSAHVNLT